jgi:branched-chain amino acid transport system substrate-binding protein
MDKLSRTFAPLLFGGALVAGASLFAPAQANELKIGFMAPKTGIFTQLGVDMQHGFEMYLKEHGNKLGGMDVKFIV